MPLQQVLTVVRDDSWPIPDCHPRTNYWFLEPAQTITSYKNTPLKRLRGSSRMSFDAALAAKVRKLAWPGAVHVSRSREAIYLVSVQNPIDQPSPPQSDWDAVENRLVQLVADLVSSTMPSDAGEVRTEIVDLNYRGPQQDSAIFDLLRPQN